MAWALVAGTAISAIPAIYKGIKGAGQKSQANAMHPMDPGYQMNMGVIDNAKNLSDYYHNYSLPGYSTMLNNINSNYQSGFLNGEQGASSSGDVLDMATKFAYGKNEALNQLGIQSAQGKQGAFQDYLQGNAAAGQEYVNKNAYDRDQYAGQVKAKAALEQAGEQNMYGSIDQLAGLGSKFAVQKLSKPSAVDSTADQAKAAFDKWFNPDGTSKYDSNGNPIKY